MNQKRFSRHQDEKKNSYVSVRIRRDEGGKNAPKVHECFGVGEIRQELIEKGML